MRWDVRCSTRLDLGTFFVYTLHELPEVVNNTENPEAKSDIIIYADDNSPTCSNVDLYDLMENIESDGKKVNDRFSKSTMICIEEKTKLLVSGTRAYIQSKIESSQEILRLGDVVGDRTSEKLLGVVVNNYFNTGIMRKTEFSKGASGAT